MSELLEKPGRSRGERDVKGDWKVGAIQEGSSNSAGVPSGGAVVVSAGFSGLYML